MENYVKPPEKGWVETLRGQYRSTGAYQLNLKWSESEVDEVELLVRNGWRASKIAEAQFATADEIVRLMADRGVYVR